METQNPEPQSEDTQQERQEQTSTPPWERDGVEFDAEKAWNLIQNLRADNTKLKEANETQKTQLKTYEDEKLSETERLQRDLDAANECIAQYKSNETWAAIKAAHPLLSDADKELIGGGSEQEMQARAAKLAARLEQAQAAHRVPATSTMPTQPTGGTDPSSLTSRDWLRDAMTN